VADGLTDLPLGIELRPAVPSDRHLLLAVYGSTRADELALVPWTDDQRNAFVEMQFDAQDHEYRLAYPEGRFLVIEDDGEPIGRLYLARLPDQLRVIDIALLPERRRQGIGSALMALVIAEADAAGIPVTLHVEAWNPAMSLYDRLGFRPIKQGPVYQLLERPATGAGRGTEPGGDDGAEGQLKTAS
jgi:GNAT superfamily N-acetyltransferase